jgi:cation transport ATPase
LRPDYATGPGVAVPLEALRDAAACAARGIIARTPDAFERLAAADLVILDDGPALRRAGLEVADVSGRLAEPELLRYAASAYRHLADGRAPALAEACRDRRIHLLDLPPAAYGPGVMVLVGDRQVRVREQGPGRADPLIVEVDNQAVGRIEFAWSRRPEAAEAVRRIKEVAAAPVVLVSDADPAELAPRAEVLGVDTFGAGLGEADVARLLRDCRARGLRAVYVGEAHRRPTVAAEAFVAVALGPELEPHTGLDPDHVAVVLLQPRLGLFADLWEIARRQTGRSRSLERFILVPNLLCVAGAFLLGTTALTSVVVSNLGTFGLYSRAVGSLRELEPTSGRGRRKPGQAAARAPIGRTA